jgi:hypothetical protein
MLKEKIIQLTIPSANIIPVNIAISPYVKVHRPYLRRYLTLNMPPRAWRRGPFNAAALK